MHPYIYLYINKNAHPAMSFILDTYISFINNDCAKRSYQLTGPFHGTLNANALLVTQVPDKAVFHGQFYIQPTKSFCCHQMKTDIHSSITKCRVPFVYQEGRLEKLQICKCNLLHGCNTRSSAAVRQNQRTGAKCPPADRVRLTLFANPLVIIRRAILSLFPAVSLAWKTVLSNIVICRN